MVRPSTSRPLPLRLEYRESQAPCLPDALAVRRRRRVEHDCIALFAHRRPPARYTQSSTSTEAEDCQVALDYIFFFLRLVFFAVFFAAVFVFVLRFFAMLPS